MLPGALTIDDNVDKATDASEELIKLLKEDNYPIPHGVSILINCNTEI